MPSQGGLGIDPLSTLNRKELLDICGTAGVLPKVIHMQVPCDWCQVLLEKERTLQRFLANNRLSEVGAEVGTEGVSSSMIMTVMRLSEGRRIALTDLLARVIRCHHCELDTVEEAEDIRVLACCTDIPITLISPGVESILVEGDRSCMELQKFYALMSNIPGDLVFGDAHEKSLLGAVKGFACRGEVAPSWKSWVYHGLEAWMLDRFRAWKLSNGPNTIGSAKKMLDNLVRSTSYRVKLYLVLLLNDTVRKCAQEILNMPSHFGDPPEFCQIAQQWLKGNDPFDRLTKGLSVSNNDINPRMLPCNVEEKSQRDVVGLALAHDVGERKVDMTKIAQGGVIADLLLSQHKCEKVHGLVEEKADTTSTSLLLYTSCL